MKKGTICLLTGVFVFGVFTFSFTATPGSDSDPIVTKSYVDNAISDLKSKISGGTSESTSSGFVVKDFKKGDNIVLGANAQIVLRTGGAKVVSTTSGLSDLTGACDVANGVSIGLNHLLLVPRDDGRGLKFTSDSTILISGNYTKK